MGGVARHVKPNPAFLDWERHAHPLGSILKITSASGRGALIMRIRWGSSLKIKIHEWLELPTSGEVTWVEADYGGGGTARQTEPRIARLGTSCASGRGALIMRIRARGFDHAHPLGVQSKNQDSE